MYITWQTIITVGKVIGTLSAVAAIFVGVVRFVDRQKAQDKEIAALRELHGRDMGKLKEEQSLLVYGVLACLKGLKERGCNGPVTEAINEIEGYINKKAHE